MEMNSWSLDDITPSRLDFEPFRFPEYFSPSGHDLHQAQQSFQQRPYFDFPVQHTGNRTNQIHNYTQNGGQEMCGAQGVKQESVSSDECQSSNAGNSVPTIFHNNQLISVKHETLPSSSSTGMYNETSYTVEQENTPEPRSPNFELYHDLIMQHLVKDIQVTCRRLGIPSDPRCWTVENTQRWLINVANQYHLARVPFDKLGLPGVAICSMGLDALKQALPVGGELIHAQLNVWMTANDYTQRYQTHYNEAMNKIDISDVDVNDNRCHSSKAYNDKIKIRCAPVCIPADDQLTIPPPDLLTPNSDSGVSADIDDLSSSDPDTPSAKDDLQKTFFKTNIHLWQFLRELLDNHEKYERCLRWMNRKEGVFKIEDSHQLAKLWGERKHRPAMNYDKLSRSLRQYYKKGILKKTSRSQRLVYQFLSPFC